MPNTFGKIFTVTTWGESHGLAVGAVIDGCPPRLPLEPGEIQAELDRRRPGQSDIVTPRKEEDRVEILAEGYETLTFDVRVPEDDTVTFTRDLEPRVDRPAADAVVVPHKTMYIVPNLPSPVFATMQVQAPEAKPAATAAPAAPAPTRKATSSSSSSSHRSRSSSKETGRKPTDDDEVLEPSYR